MARVEHQFTFNSDNVYEVNNGSLQIRDLNGHPEKFADTGPNVGYNDKSKKWALRIKDNVIERVSADVVGQMLKDKVNVTRLNQQIPQIMRLEYDASIYTDSVLKVSTQYKLADKVGGDFDDDELPARTVQPTAQRSTAGIPDLVQDLANQWIGRNVYTDEIPIFKKIVNAVDNNNNVLTWSELSNAEQHAISSLIDEGIVTYYLRNGYNVVEASSKQKMQLMRRAVEMYEGFQVVNSGITTNVQPTQLTPQLNVNAGEQEMQSEAAKRIHRDINVDDISIYRKILDVVRAGQSFDPTALSHSEMNAWNSAIQNDLINVTNSGDRRVITIEDPKDREFMNTMISMWDILQVSKSGNVKGAMGIAAASMNVSKEVRERIGVTSQTVQQNYSDMGGTNRRFGEGASTAPSMIHRPAKIPMAKPVVMQDTPAWYSAKVISKQDNKVMAYAKPKDISYKTCIDKRFPMYAVPMLIDGKIGFAYLDETARSEAPNGFTPVATWKDGVNWMARTFYDDDDTGLNYMPNALPNVISDNKALFSNIDLSGKIKIVVNNVKDWFDDDSTDGMTSAELKEREDDKDRNEAAAKALEKFLKENTRIFNIMKIDWNTGFVIALTERYTPVLLMAVEFRTTNINWPRFVTAIPVNDRFGIAVVGLDAAETSSIESDLAKPKEALGADMVLV